MRINKKRQHNVILLALGSLLIGFLSIILTLFQFGIVTIVVCIASNIIAILSLIVLFIDVAKFNKLNNPNEKSDSSVIIYIILGLIIGFIWRKIL